METLLDSSSGIDTNANSVSKGKNNLEQVETMQSLNTEPRVGKQHSLPEPAENEACQYKTESTTMSTLIGALRGGMIAPSGKTYESIELLLTAETEKERDDLTRQWRDHKLEELNFVGIVGALLAGVLTSTGSWPTLLKNGQESPWTVRTCWYSGIVFALFAVLTAAQQSLRLHRLSAHRDALANIRHYMGSRVKDSEGGIVIKPRKGQVYGWQASVMFLTLSVCTMVVGMAILIWSSTAFGPYKLPGEDWWDSNAKLAVTWSAVTLATLIAFFAAQVSLAMRSDEG